MTNIFEQYGLPLQPGEVGVRSYHAGRGPVPPFCDESLHPAVDSREVTRTIANVAGRVITNKAVTAEAIDAHTYSGPTFDGISFAD